jgi:hypothetical protein
MTDNVFDPRDFITGPYRKCPRCGGEEFGVLTIAGNRYSRRGRDRKCWHTIEFRLPNVRKTVIYIDQSAISNMMKVLNPAARGHGNAASDPFWQRLFDILENLANLQLAVRPDSDEHRNESLMSPFYEPLRQVYEQLSHGVSFEDCESVRERQIIATADAWIQKKNADIDFDPQKIVHQPVHQWNDRIRVSANVNCGDFVEGIRAARDKAHKGLTRCFAIWRTEVRTFDEWCSIESADVGPWTMKLYKEWREGRLQMEQGIAPFDAERFLPPRSAMMIVGLHQKFLARGLAEAEAAAKIVEFLGSESLKQAPFNRIASSLYAVLAIKARAGQKEPPNRGTFADVNIVSTLLPYCDAMFVDNKCQALLADIPKNRALPYQTRVFSRNGGEEFLTYLLNLRAQASEEHIKLVEEIYGPPSSLD